jgi:hypothetical protein
MNRRHALAYALIALGAVALLAQATGTADWILLGVLAAASLVAYTNRRSYAFLVLGGILAGSALGMLLTGLLPFDGVFLVSLGAALVAVDRVEPRGGRWAAYLGTVLVAIGVIAGLADSGVLGSAWLPVLLIGIGIALLWRDGRETRTFPPPVREPATTSDARPEARAGAGQAHGEPGMPPKPAGSPPPPKPAANPPPATMPEAEATPRGPIEDRDGTPPGRQGDERR